MSERPLRRHGLEAFLATVPGVVGSADGINIQIPLQPGQINLRGDAGEPDFTAAVANLLGQDLPTKTNTMTIAQHRVFWLGPNEWLLVTSFDDTVELYSQLRERLLTLQASVTDVSGSNILFRLAGEEVREVLAKGCTLDLHPDSFPVGMCAQSGLAKANVLMGLVDDQPVFDIIVRRSFSEYLALWLQSAAAEYGVVWTASKDAATG